MIKRFRPLPILPLGVVGFLLGIFYCWRMEGNLSVLEESRLVSLQSLEVDKIAFLYWVAKKRLGTAAFLLLASTTYLGIFVCSALILWFGAAFGAFFSGSLIKYGIKGILLLPAGLFPQYLFYIPGFILLIRWGESLYDVIYREKEFGGLKTIAGLLAICILLFLGVVSECCINPGVLQGILRIF